MTKDDAATDAQAVESGDASVGVGTGANGGDADVTSDAARNGPSMGDASGPESGSVDETDGSTEDARPEAGDGAGGITSCCEGLTAGQNVECCQYPQSSCNDAGPTWLNTGSGCSPSTIGGAITSPSCVGTIVICK